MWRRSCVEVDKLKAVVEGILACIRAFLPKHVCDGPLLEWMEDGKQTTQGENKILELDATHFCSQRFTSRIQQKSKCDEQGYLYGQPIHYTYLTSATQVSGTRRGKWSP